MLFPAPAGPSMAMLDVDAYTGGFNLQLAWATGRAAGEGAARFLREAQ